MKRSFDHVVMMHCRPIGRSFMMTGRRRIGVTGPNRRRQRDVFEMTVSVCMATYQGERYVERQLRSILEQLGASDEVIVVDDCSRDGTVERVESLDDPRIRVFRNETNRREVYSFSRAIEIAKGDVIFLSD